MNRLIKTSYCLCLSLAVAAASGIASPGLAGGAASDKTAGKTTAKGGELSWLDFGPEVFARAKAEKKLVLLDLEAVWCHWCHVMAEDTYQNGDVVKLLKNNYLCVRVDQDNRPDLSNKYEQYGWPATIIFDAEGHELVKNTGYVNPENMKRLLKDTLKTAQDVAKKDGPTSVGGQSGPVSTGVGGAGAAAVPGEKGFVGLLPAAKAALVKKHIDGIDTRYGGWGTYQKFLDFDSAEYAMSAGLKGNAAEAAAARAGLDGELNLLDPAFGGLYQYSTDGDWQHPHFEKIMATQTEGLRLYSLGYMLYGDQRYLQAARAIASFLDDFLSSEDGAFYTSQDADLKQGEHSGEYFKLARQERLALGLPRIDKHIYSRENGLAIAAFTYLYRASAERKYLDRAIKAAEWVRANRAIAGSPGGFRHDAEDRAGPYLGDSLAMGRAYLSLYEVTGERHWLKDATECSAFIDRHFAVDNQAGYVTARAEKTNGALDVLSPQALLDENVMLARYANMLYQYTGQVACKEQRDKALAYLVRPEVASQRKTFVAGILLADSEAQEVPLHVTIVGARGDAAAAALFRSAIALPVLYKRTEWYDRSEGPLANIDVELPELPRAAAFSCGGGRCSRPTYSPEDLVAMVARLTAASTGEANH